MHSATDVSHRNTAIIVSGPGAEATLAGGCPQDLSLQAFPVGARSRTLFGKVEVVLLRLDDDTFRVEVWRSFLRLRLRVVGRERRRMRGIRCDTLWQARREINISLAHGAES